MNDKTEQALTDALIDTEALRAQFEKLLSDSSETAAPVVGRWYYLQPNG